MGKRSVLLLVGCLAFCVLLSRGVGSSMAEVQQEPDGPASPETEVRKQQSAFEDSKGDFTVFDINSDGELDAFELKVGLTGENFTSDEVAQFFLEADYDDSGTINQAEYINFVMTIS